ncbi:MAG: hypothetical protein COB37_03540 [Kordiimonadales bacterium]|nr:MAG: hypothetical protein COB37_03540 [Kordiimonadales bacterium]
MQSIIFKILRRHEWEQAEKTSSYLGSADDERDGFVHFSTFSQLPSTTSKYFSGEADLKLLAYDADSFSEKTLKWEASRSGMLFPHLYSSFDIATAKNVWTFKALQEGSTDFSFTQPSRVEPK